MPRLPVLLIAVASVVPLARGDEQPPSPDPMAAMEEMEASDRWAAMLHGYAFLTWNRQAGPSGGREFESQNHLMLVSMRRLWGGKLSLLGTFTVEPATIPQEGSPLLFQRGETFEEVLLVDRQHPHDLFIQLAAAWDRPLSRGTALRLYLAPAGEPAVGPTAYPHRLSASENPMTPLAHHNQDSTHLSADVVTVAFEAPRVVFEASAFHGAEPDDRRYNVDQGTIDSYAGRVAFRPVEGLSFQVSAARREEPEELEEGSQTRQTASAEYVRAVRGGFVAASLIVGRNLLAEGPEWGSTLEATWKLRESHFLFGRIESVDRDLFELINKRQRPEAVDPDRRTVQALTGGYVRNLPVGIAGTKAETGLGGALTVYRFDSELDPVYGDSPVSLQVFLRLRFGHHGSMESHPAHH